MTRSNAREIAVHLVFGLPFTDSSVEQMLEARLQQEYYEGLKDDADVYTERPNQKQLTYIRSLVSGVAADQKVLDDYIEKYSVNWKLSRISKISRAIMEVAMYEILHMEDVPTGAAINEAVELCKKYDEEDASAFVNGILGSFAKEVSGDVSGT